MGSDLSECCRSMFKFSDFGHQSRFDRLLSVVNFIAPLVKGHFPEPFLPLSFPIVDLPLFEMSFDNYFEHWPVWIVGLTDQLRLFLLAPTPIVSPAPASNQPGKI